MPDWVNIWRRQQGGDPEPPDLKDETSHRLAPGQVTPRAFNLRKGVGLAQHEGCTTSTKSGLTGQHDYDGLILWHMTTCYRALRVGCAG